jgi:hypothetical protein
VPVSWASRVARVDGSVDRAWGERFQFLPWHQGSEFYDGGADPSRPVVEVTGVLTIGADNVVPLGGEISLARIVGRMGASDIWLSVTMSALRDCDPQQGDRVVALDETPHHRAGAIFEIGRAPNEDATGRANIHLLLRDDTPI